MNNAITRFSTPLLYCKTIALGVLGALIFLAVFAMRYGLDLNGGGLVRDDAVITMSHARNLVEYGFIGVSPAGERIEGYSAPFQMFLFALLYQFTEIGYADYTVLQTWLFTALLGMVFILFFRTNAAMAVAMTSIAAVLLVRTPHFIYWQSSGMENATVSVLFIASLLALFHCAQREKIFWGYALLLFAATLARTESIMHIAPVLFIFSGYWYFRYNNLRGLFFALLVLGLYALYQGWRWWYFGELTPHISYAKTISPWSRLEALFSRDWNHFVGRAKFVYGTFRAHLGLLCLLALPLLFFARMRWPTYLLLLCIASLIITATWDPLLFGGDIIGHERRSTQLSVLVVLAPLIALYGIENSKKQLWACSVILLCYIYLLPQLSFKASAARCCSVDGVARATNNVAQVTGEHKIPLPTMSIPDLGASSWAKQFNIVDIGRLGSRLFTRLPSSVRAKYYLEYAAPDVFSVHGIWICHPSKFFAKTNIDPLYVPLKEGKEGKTVNCGSTPSVSGAYIRKAVMHGADTAERRLIDDLSESLSIQRLQQELQRCQTYTNTNCSYVARTAQKFLPQWRQQNQMEQLNAVFERSRSQPYDYYLLNGWRDASAFDAALRFFHEIGSGRIFREIPKQPKDRTRWNAPGNIVIAKNDSLRIRLSNDDITGNILELSLDNNDDYAVLFKAGDKTIWQSRITASRKNRGLVSYRLSLPADVDFSQANEIEIKPLSGDGKYSLGHIRFLPE